MADRQPVDTHRLESDLAEAMKRIRRLEDRVAELEKPDEAAALVWRGSWPSPIPIGDGAPRLVAI